MNSPTFYEFITMNTINNYELLRLITITQLITITRLITEHTYTYHGTEAT